MAGPDGAPEQTPGVLPRVALDETDTAGWEALRDRVERALNYAGTPAVLGSDYKEANEATRQAGGGFKVRNFKKAG